MDVRSRPILVSRIVVAVAVVPVVVAALTFGPGFVGRTLDDAGLADRSSRANAALAARSAALVLAPVAVRTFVSFDGSTVLSVHLTARVYATLAVALRGTGPGASRPNPVFRLKAPHSIGVVGSYGQPVTELRANRVTDFALTFDLRGLSEVPEAGREVASVGLGPPAPGIWLLEMDLVDAAGLAYRASTPVMVVAAA